MDSIANSLSFMLILPIPDEESTSNKLRKITIGATVFLLNILSLISSVVFLINYKKPDLDDTFFAIVEVAVFGCATYSIAIGCMQRQDIRDLFPKLQKIRSECKIKELSYDRRYSINFCLSKVPKSS